MIRRWQAARGYPASGYLNQLQHNALLSEIVASLGSREEEPESHSSRHHGGGEAAAATIGAAEEAAEAEVEVAFLCSAE